jgi:hypothetical protein
MLAPSYILDVGPLIYLKQEEIQKICWFTPVMNFSKNFWRKKTAC